MAVIFLVVIVVLFVAYLALFGFGTLGRFIGRSLVNDRQNKAADSLMVLMREKAKASGGSFVPKDYIHQRVTAFVLDEAGKQFFIGSASGGLRGKIYPLSDIINYGSGHGWNGKSQKFFLDVTVNDLECPTWRLLFGSSTAELARVTAAIDVARHRLAA